MKIKIDYSHTGHVGQINCTEIRKGKTDLFTKDVGFEVNYQPTCTNYFTLLKKNVIIASGCLKANASCKTII